jgi:hypothetical protein
LTPAGVRGWGDPAGARSTEEAPQHALRSASDWSGNQQTSLTEALDKSLYNTLVDFLYFADNDFFTESS